MINSSTSIEHYFHSNNHLFYPKLVKALHEAIENPDQELVIADDLLRDESDQINLLFYLIDRIRIFALKIWTNIKYFFSASFRQSFDAAARRIGEAYDKKMQRIAFLTSELTNARLSLKESEMELAKNSSMIKGLSARVRTLQETITEKERTKDQILDKAKDLLSQKKENAQPKSSFFSFFPFFKSQKPVQTLPEESEITELDPDFPIDTLNDDFVGSYEKGEGNTPFLRALHALKAEKLQVESEINTAMGKMGAAALKTKAVYEKIVETIRLIETENFDNYFTPEDLEIPTINADGTEETPGTPQESLSPYETKMRGIATAIREKTASQELSILYSTLLRRLPEQAIEEWNVKENGEFTLKLSKRQAFWQPSKSMTGGAIILLGDAESGTIKGKLVDKKILFDKGMCFYVKQSWLGYIETTTEGIDFESRLAVKIGGTYLGQTLWKSKTFKKLRISWENKGELVPEEYPGGYDAFLKKKVALSDN